MRVDENGVLRLDEDIEKLIKERKPQEAYDLLCSRYPEDRVERIQSGEMTEEDDCLLELSKLLSGSEEKAAEYYSEVEKQGWTPFSMANDWTTIYGDGVRKTELPLAEEALENAA